MLNISEKNVGEPECGRKGQSAIEYLILISATVAFITLLAWIIKTKIIS